MRLTTRNGLWIAGTAFVAFSIAVSLGWLYRVDSTVLWALHDHPSFLLDEGLTIFSLLGSVEVGGVMLLVLLTTLFVHGYRALAGRLLTIFVATQILGLVMKLYLAQAPLPKDSSRGEDLALFVSGALTYPYPSGHMLRGTIVLGALYFLSENWFLRVVSLVVLVGIAANRVYFGMHWISDVIGGALLGGSALLWAFDGKKNLKPSKATPRP